MVSLDEWIERLRVHYEENPFFGKTGKLDESADGSSGLRIFQDFYYVPGLFCASPADAEGVSDPETRTTIPYGQGTVSINPIHTSTDPQESVKPLYFDLVRVGELLFLDHRLREQFPDDLLAQIQDRSIFLYRFSSVLANRSLRPYSALAASAVDSLNFKDAVVLDLGSGDGIQSLVARKRGARHIIAVEKDFAGGASFAEHLRVNGMFDDPLTYISGDITYHNWKAKLPKKPIDIVVANIGPHKNYGDRVHLAAIDTLRDLPSVRYFVGAGYCLKDGLQPDEAYARLSQYRFRVRHLFRELDTNPRLAFVAERQ